MGQAKQRRADIQALKILTKPRRVTGFDIFYELDKAITQVMDYLHIEVGEVFLRQEDGNVLRLVLHRGRNSGDLWRRSEYRLGDGLVG